MRALALILVPMAAVLWAVSTPPYAPGTLGDLNADAVYVLNQCPAVASVERSVAVVRPKHRIVHLLDLHPVPFDNYAADIRDQDPEVTDAGIEAEYKAEMAQVVRVYLAEDKLLRWLATYHGLRRVHFEGMTDADKPFEFADGLLAVPAEDGEAYASADPFKGDRLTFGGPANDAREAAIVRRLLRAGPLAIVVLGGAHDLSDEIRAAGDAEYLRVTVECFSSPVSASTKSEKTK
ncbi:MAG TPA: hypothetical protein VJ783_24005 [Pirellulales bacterium]|nr:hypothetical protein [Pirellulales bacterium]